MREDICSDFQVAHIFHLQYESIWENIGYGKLVSINTLRYWKMNSPQNGLLPDSGIHAKFEYIFILVNLDNNYKICCI